MKRNILVLVLMIFAFAGYTQQGAWSWGIQTEIGISGQKKIESDENVFRTSTYSKTEYRERKQAFGGGLWAQYQLGKHIALRSGVKYVSTGEKNGYINRTKSTITGLQTNYSAQAYDIRIDRFQLPLIASYSFNKSKLRPSLGMGVILSEDRISSIYDEKYSRTIEQITAEKPAYFPAKMRQNNMQFLFNVGVKISDHIFIELEHLLRAKDWSFSWSPDSDHGYDIEGSSNPEIIICYFPIVYQTETKYQHQTSLVLRYGF